ncbi:MAG: carboxylesterase family protein [Bacteroidales bacterium]|nr:carboxylesterase family protein [Bacteroidales bacterium]
MKRILMVLAGVLVACSCLAQHVSETRLFARRDTCDLYLDVYAPAPGSSTSLDGRPKPTLLFVFGGGFITGSRREPYYQPWFKLLNEDGYRIVAIDYRLGLKGQRVRFDLCHVFDAARKTKHAVNLGVEDVFSAVRYLADHAGELGVDPDNIVVMGNSAGAIISLTSEWEVCNGSARTDILPAGFRFVGVMSFAGAVMSDSGKPVYRHEPCPQLLLHGTADGAVAYDKTAFGRWGLFGSSALARLWSRKGYVYCIYRYQDHNHDMASNFLATWPEQKRFLEENVVRRTRRTVDALVDDPAVPRMKDITLSTIYD